MAVTQDVTFNTDSSACLSAELQFEQSKAQSASELQTGAENIKSARTRKRVKLLPTGSTYPNAKEVASTPDLLASIRKAAIKMTPEERKETFDNLTAFQKNVNEFCNALSTPATEDAVKTVVNQAQNVYQSMEKVAQSITSKAEPDHDSGLSIWTIMTNFMISQMNMNNKEMSGAMTQVQAQSARLDIVSQGLTQLNDTVLSQKSPNTSTSIAVAGAGAGIGAIIGAIIGSIVPGLGTAIGAIVGGLIGGGAASVLPIVNAATNGTTPMCSFLESNTPDAGQQITDQNSQQLFSTIGTQANQAMSTTMQLHVQQTSQNTIQYSQQFSTMVSYFGQMMNVKNSG